MIYTTFQVTFSRKMQPVQYETADASVTLGGNLGEDDNADEVILSAINLAKNSVLATLGIKAAAAIEEKVSVSVDTPKKPRKAADKPKVVEPVVDTVADDVVEPTVDSPFDMDGPTMDEVNPFDDDEIVVANVTEDAVISSEELYQTIQGYVVEKKITFAEVKRIMQNYGNVVRVSDIAEGDRNKVLNDINKKINGEG